MSRYQVHKVLRDINLSPELAQQFGNAPDDVIAEYDLTLAEQDALRGDRFLELYGMGVSPVLIVSAAMARGKDMMEVAMVLNGVSL